MDTDKYVEQVVANVVEKNPAEAVFHQAVKEVFGSLKPVIAAHPEFVKEKILDRMVEPERVIMFRVPWVDDKGEVQVNKGFRVQFNSALGPYKGGIRFAPFVNLGVIKFLGFEQTFKNSLTTLPMGGGKGGSDFNPIGRSAGEVMRFCQSFMSELYRHIGPDTDIPAGDLGVGGREIGYMFGQYKKIANEFTGVLTGKGHAWGGSLFRPEATGYGVVYIAENMLNKHDTSLKGKVCIVSGSGNVGTFTMEKLLQLGAKVVAFASIDGSIHDPEGVTPEKLEFLKDLNFVRRGHLKEYAEKFPKATYRTHTNTWDVPAEVVFPTAKENELNDKDAAQIVKNGCKYLIEGANMPCTNEAIEVLVKGGVMYMPGKAANAGGVSVSCLEMAQNAQHIYWSAQEVDAKLKEIMKKIHDTAYDTAMKYGMKDNYMAGANIAGFVKVAKAMIDQGIV